MCKKDMAQLQLHTPARGKKRKSFSAHNISIDMTPMVDLGFLLITFFIITATLSATGATSLTVPKEGPPTDSKASRRPLFYWAATIVYMPTMAIGKRH